MSDFVEEKEIESELDFNKVYSLPPNVKLLKHNEVYIAIYTEGVLWIVLQNEEEKAIFEDIQSQKSIQYLFDNYSEESVINVIVQLEAKKFETPVVNERTDKNVYLYLTNNCNQKCRHCYMFAGEFMIKETPYANWIEVLTELKAAGCTGVTFTGGEITVYKGFDKVIRHAHSIGLLVSVLTNGVLWTDDLIQKLHPYIDEVQVSLDGYDKDSYYAVRQYNGFEKALYCVKRFNDYKTKVSIAVTPLYDKLDEFIVGFEPFAKEFLKHYPDVFIKVNHELIKGREVNTTQSQNGEYKQKLKSMIERIYPDFYTEAFVLNYQDKTIRKNCGFGGISIAPNGDVYWCNRIHELKSNVNIFRHSIFEIMDMSDKVKDNTSVDNTLICKSCEIKYICGGGCRINYEGINDYDLHEGEWKYHCNEKKQLLDQMILCNEFFFEE